MIILNSQVFLTCNGNCVGSRSSTEHVAVPWTAGGAPLGGEQQVIGKGSEAKTVDPIGYGSKVAHATLDEAVVDGGGGEEGYWYDGAGRADGVAAHDERTVHQQLHSTKNRLKGVGGAALKVTHFKLLYHITLSNDVQYNV